MKAGLLGERLSHSFSPQIHNLLGDYEYTLYEKEPDMLYSFLSSPTVDALNVTIPYKKTVIPYCTYLSYEAEKIGSVNTMVYSSDGWHGYNTDYYGFVYMLKRANISVLGKKTVVLGSGGASATVCCALEDLGAESVVIISRTGENNYSNIHLHYDAEVIINTTPVGMYPSPHEAPVDITRFENLSGVADLIYNPLNTRLIQTARSLGVACSNGLSMLAAQAKKAAEIFSGKEIAEEKIEEIIKEIENSNKNIILIGMPGCGKSTVGKSLSSLLGREFVDCDEEIVRLAKCSIPEIFEKYGEEHFRHLETEVIEKISGKSGVVIATGGGCVTKERNFPLLRRNGTLFWLKRDTSLLSKEGRPLSNKGNLDEMYQCRKPLYKHFCHFEVENANSPERAAEKIKELFFS